MAISTNRPGHRATDISGWGPNEFYFILNQLRNENTFPYVKA